MSFSRSLVGLAVVLSLGVAAAADTVSQVPLKELEKRGVYLRNFSVFHLSDDGRTLLCADEPPFTIKKKGVMHRFWVFRMTPELKVESAKSYDLNVPKVEQANFSPNGQSVIFSSKRGSDIHRLDLADGKVQTMMTHALGQPGFRIHSDVISLYQGKLHTVGYFYDGEDNAGPEVMAEIDPAGQGVGAFTTRLELEPVYKQLTGLRVASLLSPQGLLLYSKGANSWKIQRWSANTLADLDEAQDFEGSWGEGPQGLYCIRRAAGLHEVVLANASTGERKVLFSGDKKMANPCLAKDGNTACWAQETAPGQATYWVGQEGNQFSLRSLLKDFPFSTLRISGDGQVVCLYNGSVGITLVRLNLPAP